MPRTLASRTSTVSTVLRYYRSSEKLGLPLINLRECGVRVFILLCRGMWTTVGPPRYPEKYQCGWRVADCNKSDGKKIIAIDAQRKRVAFHRRRLIVRRIKSIQERSPAPRVCAEVPCVKIPELVAVFEA
jgi:hypothetical protein